MFLIPFIIFPIPLWNVLCTRVGVSALFIALFPIIVLSSARHIRFTVYIYYYLLVSFIIEKMKFSLARQCNVVMNLQSGLIWL